MERDLPLLNLTLIALSMLQCYTYGLLLRSGQDEKYQSLVMELADAGCDVTIYRSPLKDPVYVKALTAMGNSVALVSLCAGFFWFSYLSAL